MSDKRESNMYDENKGAPKIEVAQNLIKERTIITLDGQVINNTPENPRAVEEYLRSKRK